MEYVRVNGVSDLTLRQLAPALGTSHRMLVYHFGSKEGLLLEVIHAVEAQQQRSLEDLIADASLAPLEQMRRMWRRLSDPALWPNERLFFEVYGQALQGRPHTRPILENTIDSWVEPLTVICRRLGVPPRHAAAHARLWIAVARGLLLDLLATGDRKGVDAAMEQFIARYEPGASSKGAKKTHAPARSNAVKARSSAPRSAS